MSTCNIDCIELTPHEVANCAPFNIGGYKTIGLADCVIDPETFDWDDRATVEAAITAGNLILIKNVLGGLTGTVIEVANPVAGGTENIQNGTNYVLAFTDANVSNTTEYGINEAFYNQLPQRRFYVVGYNSNDQVIDVSDQPATFVSSFTTPTANTELKMFMVEARWRTGGGVSNPIQRDVTNQVDIWS